MRADARPAIQDFPWKAVIRSEMETWTPTGRLPARFRPRRRATVLEVRRPLAAAAAAATVTAIGVVYALTAARTDAPAVIHTVLDATLHLAPIPAPTPSLAAPARPAAKGPAVTAPQTTTRARPPSTQPTPAPPQGSASPGPIFGDPSPVPDPTDPVALPTVSPSPSPSAPPPEPDPSPTSFCLIGDLLCL
jgi:hypothetical protein